MPLNRITLVVQPIPNLLNFAFLAALIAFAECLLPLLDSSNFPVLCRNISLYNPHYVPHLVCSLTRNHQLLKCNPICLSQILPKIQRLKTKNQRAMKSKGYLSCRRQEAFSMCCTPPGRLKDIPRGYGKSSCIQRSSEHNQRWKETAKRLLQFLLPATKNPHLLQESSLPECLAQSSYWQTLLYLTYMCFLMSETKSFNINTENMRGKCLNHCCYAKKTACYIYLFQSNLYIRACYYQFRQTTRELKTVFTFPFLSYMQSDLSIPTCQKLNLLVLDCK